MAMSRGRRLSKRQKRRSLKRTNVKSRKVMRGGAITLTRCNAILQKKTGKTDGEYATEGLILNVAKSKAGNKFPPLACSDLNKANLLSTITESL